MKLYTENIDGAKIEKRHSTIIWNYKKAQEEHGSMFAKELSM
jgi:trehalose-6-phosphatase